jgi:hypothetical protein
MPLYSGPPGGASGGGGTGGYSMGGAPPAGYPPQQPQQFQQFQQPQQFQHQETFDMGGIMGGATSHLPAAGNPRTNPSGRRPNSGAPAANAANHAMSFADFNSYPQGGGGGGGGSFMLDDDVEAEPRYAQEDPSWTSAYARKPAFAGGGKAAAAPAPSGRGGALHVEFSFTRSLKAPGFNLEPINCFPGFKTLLLNSTCSATSRHQLRHQRAARDGAPRGWDGDVPRGGACAS